MKRILLVTALVMAGGAASAQQTVTLTESQRVAFARQQNQPVRVNLGMNIFVPAAAAMSEQGLAEQENARRWLYQLATKECAIRSTRPRSTPTGVRS